MLLISSNLPMHRSIMEVCILDASIDFYFYRFPLVLTEMPSELFLAILSQERYAKKTLTNNHKNVPTMIIKLAVSVFYLKTINPLM